MTFSFPKDINGCPYLFLAPMEGVGDHVFRLAMNSIGGFDEAVTEFIRVPANAHIKSLAKVYNSKELLPTPLAAQIMGSDLGLMADMARELEKRGAPRIDINCGCPSNIVTGRGAGSSLLKDPDFLHRVADSVVKAVSVPVTVKMRSGFEDISLFRENLLAAEESGIRFLTLHPRTKVDGYGPPAKWELIAEAKSILKIPLVGNGDILTSDDALKMLRETKCDALMIGRGAAINPFIFHEIRARFSENSYEAKWSALIRYFEIYLSQISPDMPNRNKINKMKQILSFFFKGNEELLKLRQEVLASQHKELESFFHFALPLLEGGWKSAK